MRRIPPCCRHDLMFSTLADMTDRAIPIDVEARLQSNGIFINTVKTRKSHGR